ncbi:hypothetical protein EOI86_06235 [Hwanghaeella grinnelliae]|uniref:Uncharacterized protein n=1 Tax=Hwanghaeella grinnelliae TaxID=2500179 RepID=A0A437QWF3_9PROT|nr:hypothetical protein [Hwanghaeella grinnelliae]RVU38860.1 hypothetical protein EOI86_06235 [Hwanghaeella grinnelliae]
MSLRSETVDTQIASILLDCNSEKLQSLIDEAGLDPLVRAYIDEHFGARHIEDLNNRQIRDVLNLIAAFRALAKGAAG